MFTDVKRLQTQLIALSKTDGDYPQEWRYMPDAPQTVYALGNIALLKERKLTVVGSRTTTANALKLGEKIVAELTAHFVIVTGTADGGDSAAAEGALQSGRVIALLAGGFSALPQGNLPLLEKIAKHGLLLSPYEFDTPVRSFSYEYRNKLLAALGEGAFVLGAGAKSGALITAKYAEKYQKKIFAFPYPPNSAAGEGCNALIKRGACLVEESADVLSKFGIDTSKPKAALELTAEENKLYEALKELCEGHISELSAKSGVPVFKARAVLSALEIKGLAVSVGGNRYGLV
ncbi:MAG: DNA-protecting protein DprA [Clostridia bacterium]|nr:DNA-protecting protein DprA [Clostridia bacterium]